MANTSEKPIIFVLDHYDDKATATLREESRNLGLFQPGPDDVRKEAPGNFDVVFRDDKNKDTFLENATLLLVQDETDLSASMLEKAGPKLKYIVKQGAKVDNIDLDAATKKGIQVYNVPGMNSESVAELTIGLAITISRRIGEIDRAIKAGDRITNSSFIGKSLHLKTIGIIGMGDVGMEVARKWVGFTSGSVIGFDTGAEEHAWRSEFRQDRFTRATDIDELLKQSDVVSVHVPLKDSTRKLIDSRRLGLIKEGAILLNSAQPGIVDEDALLQALESGRLFGAGLDSTESESGSALLQHPRVVVTPHVGAVTQENRSQSDVVAVDIAVSLIENRGEQVPPALNLTSGSDSDATRGYQSSHGY